MEPSIYKNQKKYSKTQENRTNRVRAEISYGESIWKKGEKASYSEQDSSCAHLISSWLMSAVVPFQSILIRRNTIFHCSSLPTVYRPSGVLYQNVALCIFFICTSFSSELCSISVSWVIFLSHFSQKSFHSVGTTISPIFHWVWKLIWNAKGSGFPQAVRLIARARLEMEGTNFILR